MSEFAIATALTNAGNLVFMPLFDAPGRGDLMYESRLRQIRRVQCKTAHLADNVIHFWTCSNTGGVRQSYENDVDEFGAYCLETGDVYIVPVTDVPGRSARLRVAPTRSNQARGIRWADKYLLGRPW
jgi:hypothetical protein